MKKTFVCCSFLLLLGLGCTTQTSTRSQKEKAAMIEQLITDLYQRHLFNGAIVAGQEGKIIYSKGFGYARFADSILFTPNTTSDGGSNAKTFTATCIQLLAAEGKLKLNDPVQRYLPNYPYPNTTVWNLVTHSVGGLPDYDYFFANAPDTAIITNASNLYLIATKKPALVYPPGTNFYYDNVGFDMGALVVEKVSGMSYNEFLQKRIFDPLKMNSTFVRPALFGQWKQTTGYSYRNDSLQLMDVAEREGFYGGGNLWFTASDLYRWGESFYNHPSLSDSLIKKIMSPVYINNKLSYIHLGAWYGGKTKEAFYYWGNVAGFYSWVYWDKHNQFTIAFMTNTEMPQWARPLLTSALIDIMSGKDHLPITEPGAASVDRNNLDPITGSYKLEKGGTVNITVRGSNVLLRLDDGMEYHMHLIDRTTFYVPGFDPWISFGTLKDNKFQNIYLSSTVLRTSGKRK